MRQTATAMQKIRMLAIVVRRSVLEAAAGAGDSTSVTVRCGYEGRCRASERNSPVEPLTGLSMQNESYCIRSVRSPAPRRPRVGCRRRCLGAGKKQQRAVDPTTFCGIIALLRAPKAISGAALLFNNLNNR